MIVAGIGCRRGCAAGDILQIIGQAAAQAEVKIDRLATDARKSQEPGLIEAAAVLGLSVSVVGESALGEAQASCTTRSARVQALVGFGAIAEAAALAAAGPHSRLVLARIANKTATCALAATP